MACPDTLLSSGGIRDPSYYPGQELKNDIILEIGHWGYFRDDSDLVINSLYLVECLETGKGALTLLAEHCYSCTGREKSAKNSF